MPFQFKNKIHPTLSLIENYMLNKIFGKYDLLSKSINFKIKFEKKYIRIACKIKTVHSSVQERGAQK